MSKVFISGSIAIKEIPQNAKIALDKMIKNNCEILVGDASGVDSAVQRYFADKNYFNLMIYTIENRPRNQISPKFKVRIIDIETSENQVKFKDKKPKINEIQVEFEDKKQKSSTKSERARQSVKDVKMVEDCDFALSIWDGKSKGSYNNMLNLIAQKKKFKMCYQNKIYENPDKSYLDDIFKENNGYNLKELRTELENREIYFSSEKKMKEFLHDKKILINNAPSPEFKPFFIEKFNKKYNSTTYAYSEELVDKIVALFRENLFDGNTEIFDETQEFFSSDKEINSDEITEKIKKNKPQNTLFDESDF